MPVSHLSSRRAGVCFGVLRTSLSPFVGFYSGGFCVMDLERRGDLQTSGLFL